LSDAFAEHGDMFPPMYAASLMAGERSGNLDAVIRRYVAYEKIISAVRRKTMSALLYPAVLVLLMIVLVGIIVLRVIPAFTEFYSTFQAQLPLSTRILMGVSAIVVANIWFILIAVVGGLALFRAWVRQPSQKAHFHRIVLQIPWVGPSVWKFATSQLARTLATLLGGGIPLVNALEIAARSMNNRYVARELDDVTRQVREGASFAHAMLERGVFPDVAIKMVEVGEQTGALQEMLNSLADFYDEEIETEVGRFITLVEPMLLIVMGVVIAIVVLALYMPLFELTSVIGG
jgi:type IV pilus assembly protein PilC